MTVKELIERLQECEPVWEVYIHSTSDTYELTKVEVEKYLSSGPLCVNLLPY